MSDGTSIEWTTTTGPDGTVHAGATWNPWWGCRRVSPGCERCYAQAFDKRLGGDHWKPGSEYKRQTEKYWAEPLKWNRKAEKLGVRLKVFCASMADVFDKNAPYELRVRLWKLIRSTPHLDWLLLTKRPEHFEEFLPWVPCPTDVCKYAALSGITRPPADEQRQYCDIEDGVARYDDKALVGNEYKLCGRPTALALTDTMKPWFNVWLGVTAEDQKHADIRIPMLLRTPAAVRFVSYEPALEAVDFSRWLKRVHGVSYPTGGAKLAQRTEQPRIDWIICGAESGHGARPFSEGWARMVRDQCAAAGVPFYFKQKTAGLLKIGRPYLDGRQHVEQPR